MELDEVIAKMNEEVSYSDEKQALLRELPIIVVKYLAECDAYIAGGAVTSVFSNKEIKDFDIFFKDKASFERAFSIFNGVQYAKTENAVTFKSLEGCKHQIQFINLNFFEEPKDIFNAFDFSVCCGVYSFKEERFFLHTDFLKHLSQRKLVFNITHKFPVSSLLRSQKYKDRGFTMDSTNLLKIIMCIGALNIKTNADAAKQVQGMYFGDNKHAFQQLLKDETPFDLSKFMKVIEPMEEVPHFGTKPSTGGSIPIVVEELPF